MRAVLDGAGAVQSTTSYDPWGVPIPPVVPPGVGGGSPAPFGFTGELHDGDLVHLRARWYHPSMGTFTSRDPIGDLGGINLYTYASNNPINRVDAWGLADYAYAVNEMALANHNQHMFEVLKRTFPLAPPTGSHPDYTRAESEAWEKTLRSYNLSRGVPIARAHLFHFLDGTGQTYYTDFWDLMKWDRGFRTDFIIPEIEEVLHHILIDEPPQMEGVYYVYSQRATPMAEGAQGRGATGPEAIANAGRKLRPTEWFLAIGDYQVWGAGKVTYSCDLYTIEINLHLFDRYDWEGKNVARMPRLGRVSDARQAALHHYGLAKYYYLREKAPIRFFAMYARFGDQIVPLAAYTEPNSAGVSERTLPTMRLQ